jgi:hypothetical protein
MIGLGRRAAQAQRLIRISHHPTLPMVREPPASWNAVVIDDAEVAVCLRA